MDKLEINAPNGEILEVDLPDGTKPEEYDKIAEDVLKEYEMSGIETSGLEAGARGLMSGIPGATAAVSGIQALGDKTYEETRKANELESDKAWEEHPVAYGTGKTAGMVGTAFAVPASIPGAIGVGAASGLDASMKPEDMVKDVAIGSATGLGLGAASKYIAEPAINAMVNKVAPAVGKRTVAALGDPTLENVESYLKNPERIREALSKPQLAEKVADISSDLGKTSGHLSSAARGMLDPKQAPISQLDIRPIFEGAKQKFLTSGQAVTSMDENAIKLIDDSYTRLLELAKVNNGVIPEPELRTVIDKLQDMAQFNEAGNVGKSLKQEIAGDLQFRLKEILERANPQYAAAMKPSAEAAGLATQTQDLFGIEKGRATDKTVRQMGSLLNEPKIEEQALIAKLKDATDIDLMDMAKASQERDAFSSSSTGSALKTLFATLGFGAGKMTGIPFGGIAGAGVGRFGSEGIQGANMAKKILDFYLDKSKVWQDSGTKAALEKYGPILVNAAKQGGNKLAATYFVLGTSDPEFQKVTEAIEKE